MNTNTASQRETLNELKLTCELLKGSPRSTNLFSRLVGLVRWVLSNQTDPPTKGTASSYLTELTNTKGIPKANKATLRELAWALERLANTVYSEASSYSEPTYI